MASFRRRLTEIKNIHVGSVRIETIEVVLIEVFGLLKIERLEPHADVII